MSSRCATQSECAPRAFGSMNTAGKRGWNVVSERGENRTAAKERTNCEEPIVTTRLSRGKYQHLQGAHLNLVLVFKLFDNSMSK